MGDKGREKRKSKRGNDYGDQKRAIRRGKGIHSGDGGSDRGECKARKEKWRIIGMYVDKGIEVMSRKIESWVDRMGGIARY